MKNENGSVLKSANHNYPDINIDEKYRIAGVMVSLFRKDVTGKEHFADILTVKGANGWADVIDLASQAGLNVLQVKEMLAGQIEIVKRLNDLTAK